MDARFSARDVMAISLLGDNLLAGLRLVTTMPDDTTCT
jgi:hypothetical protein